MKRDESPIGNTCPMIDKVIDYINSFEFAEDDYETNARDRGLALEVMEKIRDANLTLREWGNDLHDEKESLDYERTQLQNTVDDLTDQLKTVESDLEDANNALSELNH